MSDYRSTAIQSDDIADLPTSNDFKGFPKELKNPKMYDKVEKEVMKIMYSDHKHRQILAFTKCKRCKAKIAKRLQYLKDTGFKSYVQYLQWKKIMVLMKENLLKKS